MTVTIPVRNEAAHIGRCLEAVSRQTYGNIIEILVIDGASDDATVEIASSYAGVRVLHNPDRIQAVGLNHALNDAKGEVFVRVDGHCEIAADYVERCVERLASTHAAMVGGAMTPVVGDGMQAAVAAALTSRFGAGPARFHVGGSAGWVDTVYLGAYRTAEAIEAGGYAAVPVNEDAELAIRLQARGGVWFDPSIQSRYTPRVTLRAVARQFFLYGRGRAATMRKHPGSVRPRQVVAPLLVLALLSPWRKHVAIAYGLAVSAWALTGRRPRAKGMVAPVMHLSWGVGFLIGLVAADDRVPPQASCPV